jgi:alpha-L-arabinofuranosidase
MVRFSPLACLFTALFLLFAVATTDAAQSPAQSPATLTVHVDRPGVQISPLLYGLFFEEINRAGDGGLYAEMVQNRSFEDADKPAAWSLVKSPAAEGTMALDTSRPLNQKNRRSLRLEITKVESGRVGVANEGFKGMSLKKGAQYLLSICARRADGFAGPIAVSLEQGESVLAAGKIEGVGPEWKKFDCSLTAGETSAAARLVIAATSPCTLWLDMVSLFPKETWMGRPNGLRPDLAEMLAAMKPAFVRFPGGCYVEGNKLANAFRWKDSIGDVAQRPGHWNLWGYRSTDGLGYHEYLQMCEDLKAEPLYVINCGMAHEDRVPMDQMGPWVQDALDAIEYANGPATGKWGALRAKAGHPSPFNLKYMEIGNENGGPLYQERYRLFYDALKARYPEIVLVADERTSQRPTEILDEHYYNNPEFFIQNAERYDKYDRKGPKIYVGEYAVTQNCGRGNLRGAIGEAAFMTGMERNSDIVVMASYAPLFVNVGWRQWNPDAINFDSSRVYGTPSYHVQKMFGQNRGDVVLPIDLDAPLMEVGAKGGAIGVGTWATQAEFKDIKVTRGEKTLFQSDFSKGLAGWKTIRGQWSVQDGALRQMGRETDVRAIAGDKSWDNYTYTLKARKFGGAEGFLIMFRVQDDNAKAWWNIGGWNNTRHAIELGGIADSGVRGRIETNRWYDIRIELTGSRIRCYLDGKLIHDVNPQMKSFYAVAGLARPSGDIIVKIVNVSNASHDTQIDLRGAAPTIQSATATILTSADPADENTLDQPNKVSPATGIVDITTTKFRWTFPAHSVTVLRLRTAAGE